MQGLGFGVRTGGLSDFLGGFRGFWILKVSGGFRPLAISTKPDGLSGRHFGASVPSKSF